MEKDYLKIFSLLDEYLKNNTKNTDLTIINAAENRKKGKSFGFNEHLRGIVLSLLSSQADWGKIYTNKQYIEDLFFNFDKEKIKKTDPVWGSVGGQARRSITTLYNLG
jgi:hypothetical protein